MAVYHAALKVLDLLVASLDSDKKNARLRDIYSYYSHDPAVPALTRSVGKQCVDLANNCLSSHRYEEAAKLLWILTQDRTVFDAFLFKAAIVVLENQEIENKDEIIWQLHSNCQNLQMINKKEIQLEYVINGLRNSTPDIQNRSQELISRKRTYKLRKCVKLDPILEAYRALLDYVEWCKSNIGDIAPSQTRSYADKAIVIFRNLVESPGNWDIFILKLVEMLEFSDRHEEIESVLLKYVEKNPTHVNSYIYVCSYLIRHNPDSEHLMINLQTLADLCPSDERVLFLIEKCNKSGETLKKCVKLNFKFLDYPSNSNNLQAWEMLHSYIHSDNTKLSDLIQSLWKFRRRTWGWMYFNPSNEHLLDNGDLQLIAVKVKVLSFFEPDHKFIRKVKKKFPVIDS